MEATMELRETVIRLFDADSLEYAGMIMVKGKSWEYRDVHNEHLRAVTVGMPIKGVLANLIYFNLVYDIEGVDVE
jgi:hypothetical protein